MAFNVLLALQAHGLLAGEFPSGLYSEKCRRGMRTYSAWSSLSHHCLFLEKQGFDKVLETGALLFENKVFFFRIPRCSDVVVQDNVNLSLCSVSTFIKAE